MRSNVRHGSLKVIYPNGEEMVAGDEDPKAGHATVCTSRSPCDPRA
jgi:hypothetical protein